MYRPVRVGKKSSMGTNDVFYHTGDDFLVAHNHLFGADVAHKNIR